MGRDERVEASGVGASHGNPTTSSSVDLRRPEQRRADGEIGGAVAQRDELARRIALRERRAGKSFTASLPALRSPISFAQRSPAVPSAKAGPTAVDSFHSFGLSGAACADVLEAATSNAASTSEHRTRCEAGDACAVGSWRLSLRIACRRGQCDELGASRASHRPHCTCGDRVAVRVTSFERRPRVAHRRFAPVAPVVLALGARLARRAGREHERQRAVVIGAIAADARLRRSARRRPAADGRSDCGSRACRRRFAARPPR